MTRPYDVEAPGISTFALPFADVTKIYLPTLTVCTIAIYLLTNAKDARPEQFRYLVAGTILSFVYDIVWLIMRFRDMSGDSTEEDGGVESSVRKFSFFMTIISLVFKFIMTFVYWMASMRFEDIIDERSALL